jgi:SAM-dependent methyltransferase
MSHVQTLKRALKAFAAEFQTASAAPPPPRAGSDLKGPYVNHVRNLRETMSLEAAMEEAVGGDFARCGPIQAGLLKHYGLAPEGYLIDVGCGSGRLAKPMSAYLTGRYLGFDLVPDLVAHARRLVPRPDWRFEVIDHIGIPEEDGVADMVCFYSVLTHLLHEQGYWYLEEARRVLRPGGRVLFSFLEFTEPGHWRIFEDTLEGTKQRAIFPLNVFIGRDALPVWAERLGMTLVDIRGAAEVVTAEGNLGQAICVLEKRAEPSPQAA